MLKEFRALLKYNAIGPTRLLQLMAINMFAIDNTALKGKLVCICFSLHIQQVGGILESPCPSHPSIHPSKICYNYLPSQRMD